MLMVKSQIQADHFQVINIAPPDDPFGVVHLLELRGRVTFKGDLGRPNFCFYGNIEQAIQEVFYGIQVT